MRLRRSRAAAALGSMIAVGALTLASAGAASAAPADHTKAVTQCSRGDFATAFSFHSEPHGHGLEPMYFYSPIVFAHTCKTFHVPHGDYSRVRVNKVGTDGHGHLIKKVMIGAKGVHIDVGGTYANPRVKSHH